MTLAIGLPPLPREVPPYRTPEWHEWRRLGVGASELPSLVGESPWMTERELALVKRGLLPTPADNDATRWGQRVEALGAADYQERTGRVLVAGETAFSERWPRLFATPDRRIVGENGLVEMKWAQRWSDPPKRVAIQCQAQAHLSGADFVDVVVMGPFGEPGIQTIERSDDYLPLLDWAQEWYERYVEGDELPPVDESEGTKRHLASLAAPGLMTATDEQTALVDRLRQARFDKAGAEKEEALARNLILSSMAGHDELEGPGFRITFHPSKGRVTTDWEAVAKAYRVLLDTAAAGGRTSARWRAWLETLTPEALDALVSIHTVTGESTRSFRPTWQ